MGHWHGGGERGTSHVGTVGGGDRGVGDGSESRVAHTDIGLAHGGVGRVDGLGVGGDLSQVAVRAEDVALLADGGGGGQASVADRVSRGHGVGGLADGDQRADEDELGRRGRGFNL